MLHNARFTEFRARCNLVRHGGEENFQRERGKGRTPVSKLVTIVVRRGVVGHVHGRETDSEVKSSAD